jgi:hypothetical protein
MQVNIFGPDPAYHEARRQFVFKGYPLPAAVEPSTDSSSGRGYPLGPLTGSGRAGIIADQLAFLVKATRLDWRGGPEVGTPHSGGVPGPIMFQFMLREVG